MLLIERSEGVETKIIKTSYSTSAGTAYVTFENVSKNFYIMIPLYPDLCVFFFRSKFLSKTCLVKKERDSLLCFPTSTMNVGVC
jgi:hypothetical protein